MESTLETISTGIHILIFVGFFQIITLVVLLIKINDIEKKGRK